MLLFVTFFLSVIVKSQEIRQLTVDKPQAVADLRTTEGASLLNAKWFVQPAHILETDFKAPGPAVTDAMLLYPTGLTIKHMFSIHRLTLLTLKPGTKK